MKETKVRVSDSLYDDFIKIADESKMSLNLTFERAMRYYRDYHYMSNKASFVNDEILNIIQAKNDLLEITLNAKTNRVLSELAIQCAIQNQILAHELEVDKIALSEKRKNAIEFLKTNNRVLRLDEID